MIHNDFCGFALYLCYFLLAASLALAVRRFFNIPPELMRKLLHMIITLSVFPLLYLFQSWVSAVLAMLFFSGAVYPVLTLAERDARYGALFSQRRAGEVKTSLLLVFGMFAVLTAVFWGGMKEGGKCVIVVAVMAWGFGDAAAALIGKAFGKRVIRHPRVEGKKTLEGTLAMFLVSLLAVFFTTLRLTALPWYLCAAVALMVAPVCAVVELFSRKGMDTVTVPLAAAFCFWAAMSLFALMEGAA